MKQLARIEQLATKVALTGAMICLVLIVVLASYQVTTRFFFGRPSAISEVASRACMIWMVLLGCAATFRRGAMIAVDFVFDISPPKIRRILAVFVAVCILLCLALLGWLGGSLASLFQRQNVAGLGISIFWIYLAFPVGAVLAVPAVLCWLADTLATADERNEVVEETAI